MKKWILYENGGELIIIQRADYIEDGGYIEIKGKDISVYEIPQYGGEEIFIKQCSSLQEAFGIIETLI